MLPYKKI